MADAPRIKRPRSLPRPFRHDELDRIMALPLSGRERVLRALLFYAGLRIGEALGLRLKDAVLGDDDRPGYVRVVGKGNKERVVPMLPELRAVLYDDFLHRADEPLTAFVIRRPDVNDARPWSRVMGERRTKVWGVAAKVEACEPHRFRHSCATRLHELGWDIRDIQEFLGHADIKTTALYAAVTPQRLVEAVKARLLTSGVLLGGSAPPPESAS